MYISPRYQTGGSAAESQWIQEQDPLVVHVPQPPRSLTLHTESQLAAAPEEAEAEQEAKPVAELGSQQSNKLVRHFSCDRPERRKSFDAELEPEPEPELEPELETKVSTKLKRLQSMGRPKNALTRQKSYDRASDQIQVRPHQLQFPINYVFAFITVGTAGPSADADGIDRAGEGGARESRVIGPQV